jgi:hypothetical protein
VVNIVGTVEVDMNLRERTDPHLLPARCHLFRRSRALVDRSHILVDRSHILVDRGHVEIRLDR